MRGLTLKHPWSWAVAHAEKRVENRDWDDRLAGLLGLPGLIGETVAIHGGAAPRRPIRRVSERNPWREFVGDLAYIRDHILDGELPDAAARHLAGRCSSEDLSPEHFILPGIVATATIQGATRASRDRWAARGHLHILLADVVTLPEPVTCPGAQGFWTVPDVIEREVRRQVEQVEVGRAAGVVERAGANWLGL